MYDEFKMAIEVGKKEKKIEYLMGVKQGDNLAPILFIYSCNSCLDYFPKIGKKII